MFSNNKIFALCIAVVALSNGARAEKQVAETFGLLGVPGVGVGVPGSLASEWALVLASGVASVGVGVPGVVGVNGVGVGVNGSVLVWASRVNVGAPATVVHDGVDVGVGTGGNGNGYSSKTVSVTSDDGASTAKTSTGTGGASASATASATSQKAYRKLRSEE
ncbi:hypothetical protein GQ600_25376 [Phytophthora cactorum]|nr:hypothetical protein GQ600_25376 [Phytophthora cactorum]